VATIELVHFRELLPLSKPHQREFYAEMRRIEGWSVRTLHERIESMLYERTALSRQPDELVKQELAVLRSRGDVTPAMLLKDPYILDFLGLSDRFLERDLEDARKLKRLIVVELKQGSFKPEYKGQMELYLRWLAKNETEPGEQSPMGIILCAGKNTEQIELLELGSAGIHVAEYLTVLPPPAVLREKLHRAIETARMRIETDS
jgi:predicted nuclease of restriction endonuclease-like (RecB) superfamily